MHITRQIAMTLLPSTASSIIASKELHYGEDLSFDLMRVFGAVADARGGRKNFAIDVVSLPSRIVVGVDRQAKNVPSYHEGYFFDKAPKPLPGALQSSAMAMRSLGFLAGKIVGAVASVLGTLVGHIDKFLGSTEFPTDIASSFCKTGTTVGAFPFVAAAWILDILPKIHRNLLDNVYPSDPTSLRTR